MKVPENSTGDAWKPVFTKHAQKDARKLASAGLKPKAQELLVALADDPYQNPPPWEKLVGDLAGVCSRRINIQHRLVYEVLSEQRTVRVLRMWTHYECAEGSTGSTSETASTSSGNSSLR